MTFALCVCVCVCVCVCTNRRMAACSGSGASGGSRSAGCAHTDVEGQSDKQKWIKMQFLIAQRHNLTSIIFMETFIFFVHNIPPRASAAAQVSGPFHPWRDLCQPKCDSNTTPLSGMQYITRKEKLLIQSWYCTVQDS